TGVQTCALPIYPSLIWGFGRDWRRCRNVKRGGPQPSISPPLGRELDTPPYLHLRERPLPRPGTARFNLAVVWRRRQPGPAWSLITSQPSAAVAVPQSFRMTQHIL